jgi:transposase
VATMGETLARWHVDVAAVRERERWHALWLLARGWSATQVAEALGRDPHTVWRLAARLRAGRAAGGGVRADRRRPTRPNSRPASGAGCRAGEHAAVGIELANWTWKAVRAYLREHSGCA